MAAFTYILHSNLFNKFYVGASHKDLENRIGNYNSESTGLRVLTLLLMIGCYFYSLFENLLKYPELREKIFDESINT